MASGRVSLPRSDIQVYCDPPSSQIVHSQDTAYYVSSKCIEHEDFPYWLAVGVEDRCRLWNQAVARVGLMVQFGLLRHVIEVQDALDGVYKGQTGNAAYWLIAHTDLLAGLEASGMRKTWREGGCLAAGGYPTACVHGHFVAYSGRQQYSIFDTWLVVDLLLLRTLVQAIR